MKTKPLSRMAIALVLLALSAFNPQLGASPMGTAFTYQGRLNDGPGPANGSYELKFTLFDTNNGGNTAARAEQPGRNRLDRLG